MELPKRKHPRLKEFDYSQNGSYFATICVKNHAPLLGNISVGRDALIPPQIIANIPLIENNIIPPIVKLSVIGEIVDKFILNVNDVYKDVTVDKYVIMPNHIHLLITIYNQTAGNGGMRASRPTLHTMIRSFKTMVTKQIGYSIWQDSYYDKVIRDENGYWKVWNYIDENPLKWQFDKYFRTCD